MKKQEKKKRKNWFRTLLSYADGREYRMWLSVILSIVSIVSGLIPFYCVYRMVEAYITGFVLAFQQGFHTMLRTMFWRAYGLKSPSLF